MTIKAIKLVSGEELIGEVVHEEYVDDVLKEVTLKNVVAVMMSRQQDGNLGIGFVPFAPYLGKNKSLDFRGIDLIFCEEVDDQMKNQYIGIFGGGILTPKKGLIVG